MLLDLGLLQYTIDFTMSLVLKKFVMVRIDFYTSIIYKVCMENSYSRGKESSEGY